VITPIAVVPEVAKLIEFENERGVFLQFLGSKNLLPITWIAVKHEDQSLVVEVR